VGGTEFREECSHSVAATIMKHFISLNSSLAANSRDLTVPSGKRPNASLIIEAVSVLHSTDSFLTDIVTPPCFRHHSAAPFRPAPNR
jgi:hypothetical protein